MVIMLAKTYIIVVCLLNDVTKSFFARRKILESEKVQITRGNINNLCSGMCHYCYCREILVLDTLV